MRYQLAVTHHPGSDEFEFVAQADAGERHGWVTVCQWRSPAPERLTAKSRSALIEEQVSARGWAILDASSRAADGRSMLSAEPSDWRAVLTAVTEHRSQKAHEYEAADLAWRIVVADTPRKGDPGYVPTSTIGDLAGLSRHRVYQIQGVGKQAGFQPDAD